MSPEFRETLALRVFSTRRYRRFRPAGASDTEPGVRPASRPRVTRGLPSAGFQKARQFRLRRGTHEGAEGRDRGLGAPVEVLKRLLDHCRIFDARNHLDRTAAVLAGQDVDLEYTLQPLRGNISALFRKIEPLCARR